MIDLSPADCARVLADEAVAHVACIADGEPYVTPMSYVVIESTFYFRTGTGRRVETLRDSPRVCVEVMSSLGPGQWESVMFWGDARFVEDQEERAGVVQALLAKYHEENAFAASTPALLREQLPIVAIEPERMTGRASGTDLGSRLRPGRL